MSQRAPELRLLFEELIVDNFAGGGGASTGIMMATGRAPDLAINHDPEALAVYRANHPGTQILCEDVFDVKPLLACGDRPVGLAWFSPDCTFFSKARGAKPHRDKQRARRRRGLAGVVLKWAAQVRPRVIFVENVEEFKEWGPLGEDGQPDPSRKGESFRRWCSRLVNLGYVVELRELRACDFGAPTSRKRLFIVARCDGEPIAWPKASHGPGRAQPFRTAAECIDWTIPCPSIFDRKRPLAEATLRRIARGIKRYVIDAKQPFIVPLTHQGSDRVHPVDEPFRTITGAHRGEQALCSPLLARLGQQNGNGAYVNDVADPLTTITTKAEHLLVAPLLSPVKTWGGGGNDATPADRPMRTVTTSKRGEHALVIPTLIQMGHGERDGQAPRALDIEAPLGTVTAGGNHHALVAAFLAKHFGGPRQTAGQQVELPLGAVTTVDHHAVVACHLQRDFGASVGSALDEPHPTVTAGGGGKSALIASSLVKLKGTCKDGQPVTEPLGTVQAQGNHYAEVRAFLIKYYGTEQDPQLGLPLATVTTKDRFAVVTVQGVDYVIVDIGMRMLSPRELFNAQGFPPGYVIDPLINGKPITKTAQVHKCGNSVPPPFSAALVRAQFGDGDDD